MLTLAVFVIVAGFLAYRRATRVVWTAALGVTLFILTLFFGQHYPPLILAVLWLLFTIAAIVLNTTSLRTMFISDHLLALFRKMMPRMSQTERDALEAGSVWWDGDLFSGNPDWNKLLKYSPGELSEEEQAFLDGPVETLCAMVDDWRISAEFNDLPPEVWQFLKENRFLGMIIPKEYGGLGFSARAHSEVVMKIASRSIATAVTVMVPNSLGPAELLMHYGTDEQRKHYLPRLATGEDMPCFALTSPEAGSDAGSIPDYGVVCRRDFKGEKDVLGIRLRWSKRYITLGPVATVLGLAFKLYDPDHLIGTKEELGITCALIPTDHDGVDIGRRHHPLDIAFQNGPNWGEDVFIPMDWIIGGRDQAGNGWRMLMNCLAAGRSISLPALGVAGTKFSARAMGAYARVRKQFKTPIGHFEGIEEPLARIAAYAYMTDAARTLTASALDNGESPSVISAILKYNLTERMRTAVNDAMDVQGGAGICLGPRNILGKLYQAIPISITVEGANILTRSMIIYGQGAVRCHPYVLKIMEATAEEDFQRASNLFDKAFFGYVGFTLSNGVRAFVLGLTGGRLSLVPMVGSSERYFQKLSRYSAAFAFLSDMCMLIYGGALKRKEKISGRLADCLSQLYLGSAVLKRFEDQGRPDSDRVLVDWAMADILYRIQAAMAGVLANLPYRWRWLSLPLRLVIFPLGCWQSAPGDRMGKKVARLLLSPSQARDRLTSGIYVPRTEDEALGRLEIALEQVEEMEHVEKRIIWAQKKKEIRAITFDSLIDAAAEKKIITAAEAERFRSYLKLRREIYQVDDFAPDAFKRKA